MALRAQDLRQALFNNSQFVTLKPISNGNKNKPSETSLVQNKNCTGLKVKRKVGVHEKASRNSKLNSTKVKVKLKRYTSTKLSSVNRLHCQENSSTNMSNRDSSKDKMTEDKKEKLEKDMKENLDCDPSKATSLRTKIDFKELVKSLEIEEEDEKKCLNILTLAENCITKESFSEFHESGSLNTVFQLFSGSHDSISLVFCHSLLLCSVSRHSLTVDEIKMVEDSILLMLKYIEVPKYENGTYESVEKNCMQMLSESLQKIARKLCEKMLHEDIDSDDVNISILCCIALKNLAVHTREFYNNGISFSFNPETISYVVGMTGKATQEISEDQSNGKELKSCAGIGAHLINQCLQVLEYALYINPDEEISTLHRDNTSFPHCLTRLLGWCITSLFQKTPSSDNISSSSTESESSLSPLYLSTLVSILKVLSSLTHNADSFSKLGNVKGLMEKVMICTLKIYFESADHQFEVLVLCLELMINLYLTDQKTFLRLCLKKFKVGSCDEMLSIEALIKILSNNLDKIKQVQDVDSLERKNEQNNVSAPDHEGVRRAEDSQMQLVLKAADKDMELSTLCSYICVLLVFFVDTKQSFKEFIQERLSSEITTDAISEARRVLEFASLTGGMSKCGILMLQHTIRILQSMHQ